MSPAAVSGPDVSGEFAPLTSDSHVVDRPAVGKDPGPQYFNAADRSTQADREDPGHDRRWPVTMGGPLHSNVLLHFGQGRVAGW